MTISSTVTSSIPGAGALPLVSPPAELVLPPEETHPDTMVGVFLRQAARYQEKRCVSVKRDGVWVPVSWSALADAAVAVAAALVHAGVVAGDRVALLAENRLEWLYTDMGAQLAGAVVVPIYSSNTPEMVRQILADCEAVAVVCSTPLQAAKVQEVRAQLPDVRTVVLFEGFAERCVMLRDAVSAATEEDVEVVARRARGVTEDDLLTIIYTSGTTGDPKGVMLTHRNVVQELRALLEVVPLYDTDSGISFLPWAHVFERVQGLFAGLMTAVPGAIAESLDDMGGDIRSVQPTLMNGVPRIYEKMQEAIMARIRAAGGWRAALGERAVADCIELARRRRQGQQTSPLLRLRCALWRRLVIERIREGLGGRVRAFASGGGPINIATLEFFDGLGITITEGYGLTETTGGVTANSPEAPRFGTVGRAVPGHEVRIAEDGEVLVRGPAVMKGYFRNDMATREAMRDGWFATGDIGELTPDGYLRITDRKKDLIVTSGGKNIAPAPIEAAMMQDPLVLRATVIGDRRKYLVALVVPDFDALHAWARQHGIPVGSDAELVRHPEVQRLYMAVAERASSHLARYETIKRVAVLDRDFDQDRGELTPTLKAKRSVIGRHFADVIDGLYE